MIEQFKHGFGLKFEKPKPEDARFGNIFKYKGTPLDWRIYAPTGETQVNTQFCANFSYCNCIETMLNFEKFTEHGRQYNLADRWSAVKSKTEQNGNTLQKVCNAGNNYGNVREEDCPFKPEWLENPNLYWKEIQDLTGVNPKQIYEGPNWSLVNTDIQSLKNALAYSPLHIGVIVGSTWNDPIVKRPREQYGGHAVELLYIDSNYLYIYDSYPPYHKKLTLDYSVLIAVSFAKLPPDWRELNLCEPKDITIMKKMVDCLKGLVSLYQQLIYKIQYGWRDRMAGITAKRASQWPVVRFKHLERYPRCSVCGNKKSVEPHHIFPFHLDIERKYELDYNNLVSLCRKNQCHLLFGHLRSFCKSYNPNVREDIKIWKEKILNRPEKLEENHSLWDTK